MAAQYFINTYCREINDGDYSLIIVHDFGSYLKLRNSIWNNIQYYIENDIEIDRRYSGIVQTLVKHGIIFEYGEISFNYRSIMLQLTSACNLNCLHCCAKMLTSDGMVTMDIVEKVIDLNPEMLVLTGGEPMLHPQFWDLVKHIRKNYQKKLYLMTNATLITAENIGELYRYFDGIDISLDGKDAYDTLRIRGKDVFEHATNIIRLLRERKMNVSISAVAEFFSEDFTNQFNELADSLDVKTMLREIDLVDEVMLNFDKIVGGGKEKYINSKIMALKESIPTNTEFKKCPMVRHSLFIDVEGNIYPCAGLAKDKYCIGKFNDLANLPDYSVLEKKLLEEEIYTNCRECIYRAGCWDCLSELENRAKFPEVFSAYCQSHKEKWANILKGA